MGSMQIPEDAYYGVQTMRAAENFKVSDLRLPDEFIHAVALIKKCAALANNELGLLKDDICGAIGEAVDDILNGKMAGQFVVDVFQTGSGTSTNMNVNEVIAGRANEILAGKRGGKSPVHPNDHVNLGQSSNDLIPTAINVSSMILIKEKLKPALAQLNVALLQKAFEFSGIRKIGRTHLQDAVPLTLGNEFSGYARQIKLGIERIADVEKRLGELALGGTAVGTGLNAAPEFASKTIALVSKATQIEFKEAVNHFEAQAARDVAVETSGVLKTIATALVKIANDLRWLSSGPRCGIGEIALPPLQPGSSIMPGKINPVIPEAVIQASFQIVGNDAAIALAAQFGNFELNTALPLIAYDLLQSIKLAAKACKNLSERCVEGISANVEKCNSYVEQSLALATNLVPEIGYDRAAELAKKAFEKNKTIREIALEDNILPKEVLDRLLP